MVYEERSLTCTECGSSFVFSADDQRYHAEKGYTNEPKRCPECRRARRTQYDRGGGAGGGGGYAGGGVRQMYPVVCAQCGKDTEVPFQPRGDRPVYCSDCYNQRRGSFSGGSSYRY